MDFLRSPENLLPSGPAVVKVRRRILPEDRVTLSKDGKNSPIQLLRLPNGPQKRHALALIPRNAGAADRRESILVKVETEDPERMIPTTCSVFTLPNRNLGCSERLGVEFHHGGTPGPQKERGKSKNDNQDDFGDISHVGGITTLFSWPGPRAGASGIRRPRQDSGKCLMPYFLRPPLSTAIELRFWHRSCSLAKKTWPHQKARYSFRAHGFREDKQRHL